MDIFNRENPSSSSSYPIQNKGWKGKPSCSLFFGDIKQHVDIKDIRIPIMKGACSCVVEKSIGQGMGFDS